MFLIEINHKQSKRVERLFVNLEQAIKKPQPALKQIGELMVASIHKNFEEQGRPTKWAPLSPMTLAMRRNKDKSSIKILQDTGRLRNSITYDATRSGGTAVAIGTNVKYGKIHQYGGKVNIPAITIVPKKAKALRFVINGKVVFAKSVYQKARVAVIPQRKFLQFQEQDISDIREVLLEHMRGAKE